MTVNISFSIAFLAGILTFFSPCFFPLIPAYLTYITGISVSSFAQKRGVRLTLVFHSLLFIFGFSLVYILTGAAAGLLGSLLIQYNFYVRLFGGILVILFGLSFLGWINLPFAGRVFRQNVKIRQPSSFFGSFLVGIVFAAGWSPCVGPILGAIFLYASQTGTILKGTLLFAFYSLGLALPLLLSAVAVDYFLSAFERVKKHLPVIEKICGVFLIIIGILLIGDYFTVLSAWFNQVFDFKGI